MASGLVNKKELIGIKKFCGNVALPAIFFIEVANVNWGTVEFGILGGMFFAKVIVFTCTAIYVCMRQAWTPRGGGEETATAEPNVLSTMGIFSIFATKSNDIALGVPLIDAVFSGANTTKFSKYLFLFAPFQLLVLNVCGFVLLEVGRIKQEAAAEELAAAAAVAKRNDSHTTHTSNTSNNSNNSNNSNSDAVTFAKTKTKRETSSIFSLLPRVLWNVATTPAVLSVILGLTTNFFLYTMLTDAEKASRPTLLPTPIETCLSTVGQGYAVTALFSIGAGMYGCFGRTTFGTKEILDGVVLIFMKTLLQAFVTNRLIAVFMAKYEGTQLFNDSADFGWLYGMTPVAPTVYMFAELYGVHSDFMALFANVCMMVAGPMMVASGAGLEAAKGLTSVEYTALHDVIVQGIAWCGLCLAVPLLLGMIVSRWCMIFPTDFIVVALAAYVGYSVQSVLCIRKYHDMPGGGGSGGGGGGIDFDLSLSSDLSPSSSSSSSLMQSDDLSAFISYFCETLYQTHMAALAVYLAWMSRRGAKKRLTSTKRKSNSGGCCYCSIRVTMHLASIALSMVVTCVIYILYVPRSKGTSKFSPGVNSRECAIEFVDNGEMRVVTSMYQLLTLLVSCFGLYHFHKNRKVRLARRRRRHEEKSRRMIRGEGGDDIEEQPRSSLLRNSSPLQPTTTAAYGSDGGRNFRRRSAIPELPMIEEDVFDFIESDDQLPFSTSPTTFDDDSLSTTAEKKRKKRVTWGFGKEEEEEEEEEKEIASNQVGLLRSFASSSSKDELDALAEEQRQVSRNESSRQVSHYGLYPTYSRPALEGEEGEGEQSRHDNVAEEDIGVGVSRTTGYPTSSPTRILIIITMALVSTLFRGVTDTVYNFKIASAIQISLLSIVMTYLQGIVISVMYLAHPYVLDQLFSLVSNIFWMAQPEDEVEQLLSTQQQQQQQQQQHQFASDQSGLDSSRALRVLTSTAPGGGSSDRSFSVGGKSFVNSSNPIPALRVEHVEDEGDNHYQNRTYSVPLRTARGSGGGIRSRNNMKKALRQLSTSSSLNRNAQSRLMVFRTRGGFA